MSSPIEYTGIQTVGITPTPNAWAKISDIAKRVGVEPVQFGSPATITAMGADGKAYDVWEVVGAVLDKIDSAART